MRDGAIYANNPHDRKDYGAPRLIYTKPMARFMN